VGYQGELSCDGDGSDEDVTEVLALSARSSGPDTSCDVCGVVVKRKHNRLSGKSLKGVHLAMEGPSGKDCLAIAAKPLEDGHGGDGKATELSEIGSSASGHGRIAATEFGQSVSVEEDRFGKHGAY
jgi:hypothetical protein